MFPLEDTRGQPRGIVAGADLDSGLGDHRPRVEFGRDPVDAGAVLGIAGRQRAGVRVETAVGRKQRGMDVQHAPGMALDERRAQHAHEAGEHDEIRSEAFDGLAQRLLEGLAIGEPPPRDQRRVDAALRGAFERRGRAVGDDRTQRCGQPAVGDGIGDGQRVAATARDEDDQRWGGHDPR